MLGTPCSNGKLGKFEHFLRDYLSPNKDKTRRWDVIEMTPTKEQIKSWPTVYSFLAHTYRHYSVCCRSTSLCGQLLAGPNNRMPAKLEHGSNLAFEKYSTNDFSQLVSVS